MLFFSLGKCLIKTLVNKLTWHTEPSHIMIQASWMKQCNCIMHIINDHSILNDGLSLCYKRLYMKRLSICNSSTENEEKIIMQGWLIGLSTAI